MIKEPTMASNKLSIEEYSIPPIISDGNLPTLDPITDPNPLGDGKRIPLRKGIVCEVLIESGWMIQNVEDNEDMIIEYSLHGDENGTWNVVNAGSAIMTKVPMYFLNRTNKDVIYLAIFKQ
jgi:hypothetical protein